MQGKRAVIRMLGKVTGCREDFLSFFSVVVVVFAFFFCWTPFHSQRLMFVLVTLYGSWTKTLTSAQHILFMISGSLIKLIRLTDSYNYLDS